MIPFSIELSGKDANAGKSTEYAQIPYKQQLIYDRNTGHRIGSDTSNHDVVKHIHNVGNAVLNHDRNGDHQGFFIIISFHTEYILSKPQ